MWGIVGGEAHTRERSVLELSIVLACMLLACCRCSFALDPALDVSQYAHKAWTVREGFSKGSIQAIAQTPDGYLWLGTEFGLVRFDGVRNVPWQPPRDQHLPSSYIVSLLSTRDGILWIGTRHGLASWRGGKLTEYPELSGQFVFTLLEDREGTVWAGSIGVPPPGRLCAIHNGSVHCSGEDGSLGVGVFDLYEDRKGNLWAATRDGLWRWRPSAAEFYPLPGEPSGLPSVGEDDGGAILISTRNGIGRLVNGRIMPYRLPGTPSQFDAQRLLRDRDGGMWIGTTDRGVVHVHDGRTDVFGPSSGSSGGAVRCLFEDREGNVWVATTNGLDRFRDLAVATYNLNEGLLNSGVISTLADKDGGVWLGTSEGLNKWSHGQISVYGDQSAQSASVTGKQDGKIGGSAPYPMLQDSRGRVWIMTLREFGYIENNRFTPVRAVPSWVVLSVAEDNARNLWIANQELGLFRLSPIGEIQQIPWAGLGHKDHASVLAANPLRGGLWLGFFQGGVAYFSDGGIRAAYGPADGLGEGKINSLRVDEDGTLWTATDGGLSRFRNGHFATLSSKNGLPCDTVHWSMEDSNHSFWLYMPCGLVRIARSELDGWIASVDKDKDVTRRVISTVFDSSDGVRAAAEAATVGPQVAESTDGKLWFASRDGVSVIDPRHLPYNKLPPPVHIEQITADHKTYPVSSDASGNARLPPLIRDLQIDYTALSLVAPEKVLFRYKLEGWDGDWQDAGTRRQAFYSNLPPRDYRFHVIACNNSGVWNEAGTFLNFSVAPAYYQTWWFRLLCVTAFLALLGATYQLRLWQVERQFNMRMEERVNERTRIARDLHDTLLQSFQGVLLKFHAVTYSILDRPAEAQKTLQTAIEQARQAITEGRDAVQGLRSSTLATSDIAQAISTFGEELATTPTGQNSPDFHVLVEGVPRDLAPLLRDEIYRITGEALRNAFRHAHAQRIEVEIRYDQRQLRLRVRDDGKGIDPTILNGRGRPGHYGLPGMHERAKLVGGKLAVWSELNSGTEAELSIPASIAYAKSSATRRSTFWRRSA
jgi:signal transduction histidine kinase/ligand-binding sensor domain-containing protein